MGERSQCPSNGVHQHHRTRPVTRRDCCDGLDVRIRAIKTNIADSLDVVIQVERRPGRRYISEVLEINSYDPDTDLFDYCAMYVHQGEKP